MNLIGLHKDQLAKLCKKHNVSRLYITGSAVSGNLTSESDLDFIIRFKEISITDYFLNYLNLKKSLRKLFKRPIDLIEEQTLKNPVLINSLDANKLLIYGSENS